MKKIAAGALWITALLLAASFAYAQGNNPAQPINPNEAPAGHSMDPDSAGGVAAQGEEHAEAAVEHGEAHAEQTMPHEIWWKWANFAILFGGLGYLIAKNAGPFFAARTMLIQQGISEATKVKADAEARAQHIETRIGSLSADVDSLRSHSKEEITAESRRLQAETSQQIAKIQTQAEAEIASAAKRASADLKAYSAGLALDLAEAQIRQNMTGDLQHHLHEAFIKDIQAPRSGALQAGAVQSGAVQ